MWLHACVCVCVFVLKAVKLGLQISLSIRNTYVELYPGGFQLCLPCYYNTGREWSLVGRDSIISF